MPVIHQLNADIAARLEEVASVLEAQDANPYRVNAYRRAATTIRNQAHPVSEIVEQNGIEGLDDLPGIGESLSRAIFQMVKTGTLPMLERLRGESDPVEMLSSVSGIGKKLAERLYDDLGIHSLEELEAAAHDGRLREIAGFGEKRVSGIRDSLASRLGGVRKPLPPVLTTEPTVSEILAVDSDYRRQAEQDTLPKITPRRFNPKHEAWLPVLHTTRGDRHYTALFSNTGRAHQENKTHDWVVIYYDGGQRERQCTVITSMFGPLEGKRIVRGRESECSAYYFQTITNAVYTTKQRGRL